MTEVYKNEFYEFFIGSDNAPVYRAAGSADGIPIEWPVFELDGSIVKAAPDHLEQTERRFLNDNIEQITLSGRFGGSYELSLILRVCSKTPFVRFRYVLSSDRPSRMTKLGGETLVYLSYAGENDAERTEIRFSEYDSFLHSYMLEEIPAFAHEDKLIGPILTERRGDLCMLTAYEHGSMYPDIYVGFVRTADGVAIRAVKGNYWDGRPIDSEPYKTIWLQLGAVKGDRDDLAKAYRAYQLSYCSLNRESRKPYIFYNTWAYQERNKFYNKQNYLSSMNQERIEREIDIAGRMGVDVFVLDTGWYEKTGEWQVNRKKFPDGLEHIRDILEKRGMKLGLWFAPGTAAESTGIAKRHKKDIETMGDEIPGPHPVWETEPSFDMCPVSDYKYSFADELIRLARDHGVRYFKWDAVGMYGCDNPNHLHGDESCPARDRHENYSFQIGLVMSEIVDRLCEAIPDAIVDMDVTEGGRYFGLGFLSSGKYFAINNGPYYQNYDISIPADQWTNIFVNPGPARSWVLRQSLCYDKWIPSVLMMAHYIPDDPQSSQLINIASMILGQNGVWGDLPAISDEGVRLYGDVLKVYKTVRDDITRSYPEVYGRPGGNFEVREKIDASTGRGVVCIFGDAEGEYSYRIGAETTGRSVVFGSAEVVEKAGRKYINARFGDPGAAIVFFV